MNASIPPIDPVCTDADLVRRWGPALVLFARGRCDCAEDVVQEAFVKLFRLRHRPDNIRAWLFRVVRNESANAYRSQVRRERHEQSASQNRELWFEPTPGATIDIETATAALQNQPVEVRETIVARLWGGLSFDEIAVLTEVSPSTASRRYQSGLQAIRQQLHIQTTEVLR
ncbi:RNA polymerase sigma factor [Allorhodopirellula solitaria]|uniref:ECF RNA polymerase sigma factor SigE n=1 Tax=Allorhodopirellula solitaria TaxID=2527987 RepID=A0A5C5X999_9BACT|nr:sigma-70 family RNA polymerase sigma factor [Allorhodopirellula solitaria]TWT59289.1 ECF RNA polymerase sigma factor SigE [Allorhodopirellula solitaria]